MKETPTNPNTFIGMNFSAPTSETVEASKNCVIEILNAIFSTRMTPEVAITALKTYKEGIGAPHNISLAGCNVTMKNPTPADNNYEEPSDSNDEEPTE